MITFSSPTNILITSSYSSSKTSSIVTQLKEGEKTEMVCGETKSLKAIVRDRFQNRKGEGEQLKCTMVWPSATSSESHDEQCRVEYIETGEYICTYGSKKAGNYILNLLLDGEHIVGSPLYGKIKPNEAEISMCDIITLNNEIDAEQMDIFVNKREALKMHIGTKTSWTLLEKDINGNRRENCSLSFKCTLNVLEWEVDPFKKREEDIADDRLRFQQNINNLEAKKREKEFRRQKVQDAKNLIKKREKLIFKNM